MDNKDKEPIPARLQRFLGTTARRDNIGRMQVAAVVVKGRNIAVRNDGSLPQRSVWGMDIGGALKSLLRELMLWRVDKVVYLGAFDSYEGDSRSRSYSFLIEAPPQRARGLRMASIKEAVPRLDPRQAKLIMLRVDAQDGGAF